MRPLLSQSAISAFFHMDWLESPQEVYHHCRIKLTKGWDGEIDNLLGCYYSETNKIVIYPENVIECAKHIKCDPHNLLEIVRLHEYGHALHCLGWAEFARNRYKNDTGLCSIYGRDTQGFKEYPRGLIVELFKDDFQGFCSTFGCREKHKTQPCPGKEWVAEVVSLVFAASRQKDWPELLQTWRLLQGATPKTSPYWIGNEEAQNAIIEKANVKNFNGAILGAFVTCWLQPWHSNILAAEGRNEFFDKELFKELRWAKNKLINTKKITGRGVEWMWYQHTDKRCGPTIAVCSSGVQLDSIGSAIDKKEQDIQCFLEADKEMKLIDKEGICDI